MGQVFHCISLYRYIAMHKGDKTISVSSAESNPKIGT